MSTINKDKGRGWWPPLLLGQPVAVRYVTCDITCQGVNFIRSNIMMRFDVFSLFRDNMCVPELSSGFS